MELRSFELVHQIFGACVISLFGFFVFSKLFLVWFKTKRTNIGMFIGYRLLNAETKVVASV